MLGKTQRVNSIEQVTMRGDSPRNDNEEEKDLLTKQSET